MNSSIGGKPSFHPFKVCVRNRVRRWAHYLIQRILECALLKFDAYRRYFGWPVTCGHASVSHLTLVSSHKVTFLAMISGNSSSLILTPFRNRESQGSIWISICDIISIGNGSWWRAVRSPWDWVWLRRNWKKDNISLEKIILLTF